MIRQAIRYTGRVQGVGFRATAEGIAARFDVTGWVRNEPDGSVRLEVQGEPGQVRAMTDTLAARMRANIASAHTDDVPPLPGETEFAIRL